MSSPKEPGSYWKVVDGTNRKRKLSARAKDAEESNKPDAASSTNRFAPLKRASPDGDYTEEEDDDSGSGSDTSVIDVDADEEVEALGAEVAGTLPRQMPQLPAKRPKKPKPVAQGGSQVKDKAPAKKKRKTTDAADASQPAVQQPASTAASTASAQGPAQQDRAADAQQSTRKTGLIWNFYRKSEFNRNGEPGPDGSKHWKCAHCNYVATMTKGMKGNINSFVEHLEKKHANYHNLYLVMKKRDAAPSVDELRMACGNLELSAAVARQLKAELQLAAKPLERAFERQSELSQTPFDQKELENLIMRWIVARDQPFEEAESDEFIALLNYVHHRPTPLKIPSSDTVKRRAIKMGTDWRAELKEILAQHNGKFSLALDAWTSPNYYPFLAIILYYVNDDWELEEILLDFRELVGEHSGVNLAAAVWETLDTFGLRGRVLAIASDNASNMDTMMDELEILCVGEGIDFDARRARIRCTPHIIHLAACKLLECLGLRKKDKKDDAPYQEDVTAPLTRDFDDVAEGQQEPETDEEDATLLRELEALASAIPKLRAIIRGIRSSPQRRQLWLKEVAVRNALSQLEDRAKMLILDVSTRWSSTHQMLRRALHYKDVIQGFVAQVKDLRPYELSDVDWEGIKIVCDWLKAFRDATTQMSTTSKPMLSSVYAIFTGLQDDLCLSLKKLPADAPLKLIDALAQSHTVLANYFYKTNASPYYVWAALLDPRLAGDLETMQDDADVRSHIRDCMTSLREHYVKHYVPVRAAASSDNATPATTAAATGGSPVRDFTARFRRSAVVDPAAEFDEFFSMRHRPDFATTDPLQWWRQHSMQFPHLSRLARDILSIPGSAVAVERIFSSGRDVITLRRSRLKPETISTLMLLKHKLRLDRERAHRAAADTVL